MSPIERMTIYTSLVFIFRFVAEIVHKSEGLELISRQGRYFLPGYNIPTGPGANFTSCNDTKAHKKCFIFTCLHGVVLKATILYFIFEFQKYVKLHSTWHFTIQSLITKLIQTVIK
jgi:hypothetical protein